MAYILQIFPKFEFKFWKIEDFIVRQHFRECLQRCTANIKLLKKDKSVIILPPPPHTQKNWVDPSIVTACDQLGMFYWRKKIPQSLHSRLNGHPGIFIIDTYHFV